MLFSKLEKGNLLATFVLWSFGQNLVSSFWSKRLLFIAGQTILKILIKYIKHETQCFITRWYTEKRVENTTRSRVFLTNFEVFHLVIKRCVDALIYYINIFRIFWPALNNKHFRGSCFKININLFELWTQNLQTSEKLVFIKGSSSLCLFEICLSRFVLLRMFYVNLPNFCLGTFLKCDSDGVQSLRYKRFSEQNKNFSRPLQL